MAFNKQTLINDLKKVFSDMESNDDFANGIAKACKDFGESGTVVTVDVGAVSSGAFTGSGSGSLSLSDSLMSSPIITCCESMNNMIDGGDTLLANAIGNGLLAMTTAGSVKTNVVGTTISPTGSPVPPTSGTAEGKIVCQNAPVISALISCFKDMKDKAHNNGFSGDKHFAEKMADCVSAYFISGVITTNGQGALAGATGSGTIS